MTNRQNHKNSPSLMRATCISNTHWTQAKACDELLWIREGIWHPEIQGTWCIWHLSLEIQCQTSAAVKELTLNCNIAVVAGELYFTHIVCQKLHHCTWWWEQLRITVTVVSLSLRTWWLSSLESIRNSDKYHKEVIWLSCPNWDSYHPHEDVLIIPYLQIPPAS